MVASAPEKETTPQAKLTSILSVSSNSLAGASKKLKKKISLNHGALLLLCTRVCLRWPMIDTWFTVRREESR